MRQIAFAQHGTSAFIHAFVVVIHPKIYTKNTIFVVKKKKKSLSDLAYYIQTEWLLFHTQNMASSFFPFRPKKTMLQLSNTYMVTSTV